MVPADLATIYDFNPLFAKGITGTGQTIAVIEDTDLYSSAGLDHLPQHLRAFAIHFGIADDSCIPRRRAEPTIALHPGVNGG